MAWSALISRYESAKNSGGRKVALHFMVNPSEWPRMVSERERMVEAQLRARGIRDQRVLGAMGRVPRDRFVENAHQAQAYEDHPLPIALGQTISQPYIVGAMLEALALGPEEKVLEVGTGSGYVTALLCELAGEVYSIERHAELSTKAAAVLAQLGYDATLIVGNGSRGWLADAPYDAVLVSAAAPTLPPDLFTQLRDEGRMVIPLGPPDAQELQLVFKRSGSPVIRRLDGCRFVPLISEDVG
jgi:protein-L-isoaspartate(D-aspartate) O-methyltransferase